MKYLFFNNRKEFIMRPIHSLKQKQNILYLNKLQATKIKEHYTFLKFLFYSYHHKIFICLYFSWQDYKDKIKISKQRHFLLNLAKVAMGGDIKNKPRTYVVLMVKCINFVLYFKWCDYFYFLGCKTFKRQFVAEFIL